MNNRRIRGGALTNGASGPRCLEGQVEQPVAGIESQSQPYSKRTSSTLSRPGRLTRTAWKRKEPPETVTQRVKPFERHCTSRSMGEADASVCVCVCVCGGGGGGGGEDNMIVAPECSHVATTPDTQVLVLLPA